MPQASAYTPTTITAIPALLRRGGCVVMLAIACAAPFAGVQYGALDPCDESYQALCVADYASQPAAPAVFALGALWQRMFGTDALTLRYLGMLCVVVSLAIGALWYYHRRGSLLQASALMMTASLTATPAIFRFYNWDTGTYPAMALALVTALSLWTAPRRRKALMLGALCAILFLCRVQLIVCLPLALWLVWQHRDSMDRGAVRDTLAAFAAIWLAGAALIFGSGARHIDAIMGGNFISGHTIADWRYILRRAWLDALDLPLAFLPLVAAWASAAVFSRFAPPCRTGRISLALLLAGWVVLAAAVTDTLYLSTIFASDLPLFLLVALLPALWRCGHGDRGAIWICVVAVALTAFGSDAIAERYFASFALAPLAAVVLPSLPRGGRHLLWTLIAFAALAGGCVSALRYHHMRQANPLPMDRFPRQEGLLGSGRALRYWQGTDSTITALGAGNCRFVCRPYGLQLCYGGGTPAGIDMQRFHFADGDATPSLPPAKAYIFTLASPQALPVTVSRFSKAGYKLAATEEGEYFILEHTDD